MSASATTDGLVEMPVRALRPGMYVAAIDRPWQETPFALQGFHVNDRRDIERVARYCRSVQVDPRRLAPSTSPLRESPRAGSATALELLPRDSAAARESLDSADRAMRKVFEQLKRGGRLEVAALEAALGPLVKSVLRDAEVLAALLRIRRRGEYLYNHSLSNAVWAAVLGRHLGFPPAELERLALGASLLDVGMTRLALDPHAKPAPLSAAEMRAVREHVELGLDLLGGTGRADAIVLDIVRCHHERFDGSGYPRGLAGHDIPLPARLVGLVDNYDAMITPRPHASCRTSFEAMQELWHDQAPLFQRELVEQLIQALGLFPTGALVELSSGEVGIVVEQNPSRRLRPKVIVVLDERKRRYRRFVVVDLSRAEPGRDGSGELWIRRELQRGAHGLHPDEFFL